MVIKFMESTYDVFKDRLKNPFFGTLLVVWILRNREFLFNLLFNENYNSEKTLNLLHSHFEGSQAIISLLTTIAYSLLLLALFYGALNLSRFVLEFSETTIKPKVSKIFSGNNIVSKEEYSRIETERDFYQKKYTEERKEKIRIQMELNQSGIIDNKIIDGGELNDEDVRLKMVRTINKTNRGNEFKEIIGLINSRQRSDSIQNLMTTSALNFFFQNNLIHSVSKGSYDYFEFTDFGKEVRDYYLSNPN